MNGKPVSKKQSLPDFLLNFGKKSRKFPSFWKINRPGNRRNVQA